MPYNPNIHRRRSIRLKGYDYAQAGLYFITICCQDRACLFGEIKNGKMILNTFGKIAREEWLATEKIRDNTRLHEFIVMPNHIHGIIEIIFKKNDADSEIGKFQSPSQTIGAIIRGYKIATIKKIKDRIQNLGSTGELQFASTEIVPKEGKGIAPTEFAPTEFASTEFASTELASKKKIIKLDFKIWQRNYYEIIIRDEKAYENISNYIINNAAKWDNDKFKI